MEYGIKKRPNNESFDKIWYISRSIGYIKEVYSLQKPSSDNDDDSSPEIAESDRNKGLGSKLRNETKDR